MSLQFERVVGAAADVRELEYIAALHQTQDGDDDGFRDGSIEATDVRNYLLSRYGVNVTKDVVRESIFRDLAGGDTGDDCIDIVELVAILIIPHLRRVSSMGDTALTAAETPSNSSSRFEKVAHEKRMKLQETMAETNMCLVGLVLELIMTETTGSVDPKPLTKELLREIFESYGEAALIGDDDLLTDMIELATGGESGVMLDTAAFTRGLTSDIQLYDPEKENTFTTHYEDVFGSSHSTTDRADDGTKEVPQVFTFNQIDSLSDSFREKLQHMFAWIAVLVGFLSYVKVFDGFGIQICKADQTNTFLCSIGQSIVVWCIIMAIMVGVIAPCVMILSLGNNGYSCSLIEVLVAILGIGIIIFFPALYNDIDTGILSTKRNAEAGFVTDILYYTNVTIGSILLFFQIGNLIRFFVPDDKVKNNKFLTLLLRGSGSKIEFGTKQAAVSKVQKMLSNAYHLHNTEEKKSKVSQRSNALLNYEKETEKHEPCGGFFWSWRRFVTGDLLDDEGITIHTRLLTGNLAQFGATFLFLILGSILLSREVKNILAVSAPENTGCPSLFDPADCYFPNINGTSLGVGICSNVFLLNSTCLDQFQEIGGTTRDTLCETIEILELTEGPVITEMFNYTCPSLYAPYPSAIYTATTESVEDSYCSAPITACVPTGEFSGGYSAICVIGIENTIPFNFYGTACPDHIEDSAFDIFLDNKAAFDKLIDDSGVVPKKWMLTLAGSIGLVVSFVAGFFNSAVNIPSQITTIMKYRTGAIETLRNPNFKLLRKGMLSTTYLLGSAVWASLFMSIIITAFIAGIVFLCVYKITQPFVLKGISILIGVMSTIILKMVISTLLDKLSFVGFYRKRPLLANLGSLTLECWHLATTSGFVVVRVAKLLVVTLIYLGRFDKPILADGVGVFGPVKMDTIPFFFQTDMLATEAHRHPYIERLGMMYLMKLRNPRFGCKAGSIWRLLFCFALMPWLRKYRIEDGTHDDDDVQVHDVEVHDWSGTSNVQAPSIHSTSSNDLQSNPKVEVEA